MWTRKMICLIRELRPNTVFIIYRLITARVQQMAIGKLPASKDFYACYLTAVFLSHICMIATIYVALNDAVKSL